MLTSYHTLSCVTENLRRLLLGKTIVEAFTQERDQLVLRFAGLDEALVISCGRALHTAYFRPNFNRARANSADVLARSLDQTIAAVQMHPVERVVMFKLESGLSLDARFFGAKTNVVLIDEKGVIVDAFKDAKKIVGTAASYRSAELLYDIGAFRKNLASPTSGSVYSVLKETFPTLGSTLAKEVLHRATIASSLDAKGVSEQDISAIQSSMSAVFAEIAKPKPKVFLRKDGKPLTFSLIPLHHLGEYSVQEFDDVDNAIRFWVSRVRSHEFVDDKKKSLVGKLQQKLSKMQRTIEAVENDLRNNSRAQEYQESGELLMANLQEIKPGDEKFVVRKEGGVIEIPLVKGLAPAQSAQRYFEKAKRSRTAQKRATERLHALRASVAPATKLLSLLHEVNWKEELKEFMYKYNTELEEFGIGEKSEHRETLPFRVFIVDGGFEVWAGKSSKNNDELTLKHAKPNDWWFHARGASGSHVVLKVNTGKGEPGKRAKEQAAGIAAYYSKMKNAKMVPVAMTEKKYVRKPKGASPGSVMVEREKVIFAEPALPGGEHH